MHTDMSSTEDSNQGVPGRTTGKQQTIYRYILASNFYIEPEIPSTEGGAKGEGGDVRRMIRATVYSHSLTIMMLKLQ